MLTMSPAHSLSVVSESSRPQPRTGYTRPRAQAVDQFVGDRIRSRRINLGLSLQQIADAIGVTYQQAHKYEKGANRIAASRLPVIAQALGVEVSYFFEGLNQLEAPKPTPQQRMLLELARSFQALQNRRQQAALCELARAMVKGEIAGD
jgi:transcriptional regulator with XRE-family HTH domain